MLHNELIPEPLANLLDEWSAEAELLSRRGADAQASAIESMIGEVQGAFHGYLKEPDLQASRVAIPTYRHTAHS